MKQIYLKLSRVLADVSSLQHLAVTLSRRRWVGVCHLSLIGTGGTNHCEDQRVLLLMNVQETGLKSSHQMFIFPPSQSSSSPPPPPPSAGETYSEKYSHTEECRPCTQCTGLMRMETPCTDSNDAICICKYNFYFNALLGRCEPCTVCPVGMGVFAHCEHDHDTVCEECVDYTFSDRESSLDPCLPCTICEDEEVQLAECTPTSDSVCHSKCCSPQTSFIRVVQVTPGFFKGF